MTSSEDAVELGDSAPTSAEAVEAMENGKVENGDLSEEDKAKEEKEKMERDLITKIVQGVAATSIVVNIVAVGVAGGVMILAGLVAVAVASAVIYYQQSLQDTGSLRKAQNDLRDDTNKLITENNKLVGENNRLAGEVGRLKEQEARLDEICKEQGSSASEFVNLLKENEELLKKSKGVARAEAVQLLSAIVIKCDFDLDGKLSKNEIKRLILRLQRLPNVVINEKGLKRFLAKSDGQTTTLMRLVASLRDENPRDDSPIMFKWDTEADVDEKKEDEGA